MEEFVKKCMLLISDYDIISTKFIIEKTTVCIYHPTSAHV